MLDWPSPVPLVAASAEGATLTTIDGQTLNDFCLGDTASMFGHSPPALAAAIAEQAAQGLSYMLPTRKSDEVSALLASIFGLPRWQVTTTASEANRAVDPLVPQQSSAAVAHALDEQRGDAEHSDRQHDERHQRLDHRDAAHLTIHLAIYSPHDSPQLSMMAWSRVICARPVRSRMMPRASDWVVPSCRAVPR